jgi:predicted small secreted protein
MATIQLTPGTGGFPNTITFTASGLPPNSTGSFNPPSLTPPIAGATTTVFTLTTMSRSGSVPRPNHPLGPLSGGWIATAILSLLAMLTLRRGFRMQRFAYLPIAVLLLSAAIVTGCATASGTPAGSYTVTITATSGSYSQTTSVPVTVQ